MDHIKTLDEIDKQKQTEYEKKIQEQLEMCDRQLKAVKERKKKEKKD
jgi:hypothetical protein